jgi:hypothetical protein
MTQLVSCLREQESEPIISMNCQNNVDINSLMAHKTELPLKQWLQEYDILLEDTSVDKQELYDKIILAQKKVIHRFI